jgi:predicted phage terminase large subunit-like protein
MLAGIDARGIPSTGNKMIRAKPLAAQAEAGNVHLFNGFWNERFLIHMHSQGSDYPHDDIMDASDGAFEDLSRPNMREARSYQG